MKLPSLNEYVNVCRANRYQAAAYKKRLEAEIGLFTARLPRFERPVKIHFHWIEDSRRRDYDNVCFAKKFILDALVKQGKLKDDNRKCVTAFTDTFGYGEKAEVILTIMEVENGKT
jgi:Holliday junction resolvase RusA-like endonuclease